MKEVVFTRQALLQFEESVKELVEQRYFSEEDYAVDYINHGEIAILSHTATITVLRGKQKIQLTLSPRYANFSRFYWLHESDLEKVRK